MTAYVSTLVRPTEDAILRGLRDELADALTPGQYDRERATRLQDAIAERREQISRYRRVRRAVMTISDPERNWWL